MTVKNFLKTAVLGIAFCSVLGMNNSMAADNNIHNICVQIQNQIHVSIHNEFMPYCAPECNFKHIKINFKNNAQG